MIRALDASSFQGAPDWGAVRAGGVELVILKASEGTQANLSSWYHREQPRAAAAGLLVAAYHFAYTPGDPAAQAQWFAAQTAGLPDRLILSDRSTMPARWLDLESGAGDLTLWAGKFLSALPAPGGFYSYKPFVQAHISPHSGLGAYPLWLAAYQSTCPAPPAPWPFVTMWQNTSSASEPGILGRVDSDYVVQGGPLPTLNTIEDDMAAIFHNDDDARRCWVREQINRYWHREPTADEMNLTVWALATGPSADAVLANIIDSPNTVR